MLGKIRLKIFDFITKYRKIIFIIIITLIAFAIRWQAIDNLSGDMYHDLGSWFRELKNDGGLIALKDNIGNYNVPYLVILALLTYLPFEYYISIKMVSIIFDYILAISIAVLTKELLKGKKKANDFAVLAYGLILILPTVFINSADWGQCDSIYAAFLVISLIFLMKEKYFKSFVFLGISFAFKLQFVFILPVYIFAYIKNKKFPIVYFLIIPAVNLLLCSPAIIAGRDFKEVAMLYIDQAKTYEGFINLNSPSFYNLLLKTADNNMTYAPNDNLGTMMVITTIAAFGIIAYGLLQTKEKFDNKAILSFAILSIMICNFFLPGIHERYGYVAEVLSVVYFIVNKKDIYLPVALNMMTLVEYSNFIYTGTSISHSTLSIIYLIVLTIFASSTLKKYIRLENENE